LCDRLAVLHAGAIAECVPVAQIEQALHPATLSLLRSLPVPVQVLLSHIGNDEQAIDSGGSQLPLCSTPEEIQGVELQKLPDFKTFYA